MKSEKMFRAREQFWCKLKNREFLFFVSPTFTDLNQPLELVGVLSFDLYQVTIELNPTDPGFYLRVHGSDQDFYFTHPEKDETALQEWIDALGYHIQASEGLQQQLSIPANFPNKYWASHQISAKKVLQTADTFDILLFRCKSFGGRL